MTTWNTQVKFISIPEFVINNGAQIIFANAEEQQTFFNSHVVTSLQYENLSYVRVNGGTMRIKINVDSLTALAPNWVMFKNSDFGNKWFYANITDMYYISPEVTEISYAVDSFQSFMFELNLNKKSYVARRTWCNEDNENDLMQLPMEDLDVGNDYVICDAKFDFNDTQGDYSTEQWYYLLLTTKLTDYYDETEKPWGTTRRIWTNTHQQGYLEEGEVVTYDFKNGINTVLYGYVMNFDCLNGCILKGLFSTECNIVNSLQMILELPFGRSLFNDTVGATTNAAGHISFEGHTNFGKELIALKPNAEMYDQHLFGYMRTNVTINNWCEYLTDYINKSISGNYDIVDPVYDSDGSLIKETLNSVAPTNALGKYLYRYPYSLLEVYDFYNQPDNLKIECINHLNQLAEVKTKKLYITKMAAIGQNPMLVYGVRGYKNNSEYKMFNDRNDASRLYGLTSANLTTIQSTLSLPIISDYLASFLQANQNQINATRANLRDTLQTQINNAGASLQAEATSIALNRRATELQARTQANTSNMLTRADLQAKLASLQSQRENMYVDAAGAMVKGAIGGGTAGGTAGGAPGAGLGALGGMVAAGVSAIPGIITQTNTMRTDTANSLSLAAAQMTAANQMLTATTQSTRTQALAQNAIAQANYGNAMRTASNAYRTEMRALNARIQDAANIPASVQSMGNNGSIFNLMFNRDMIKFTTKALPTTIMQRLIDYFVYNGFITNKMENLQEIFTRFSSKPGFFIQTINANVAGNIPADHMLNIKSLFDNGIYFWNKEHFLDYDSMRTV